MFLTIVKKELLANLLSLRFTISLLLCFVLILVSAYTMREKYETQVQEYNAAVKMRKEILEKATSIGELGGGYNLDKPPVPLSIIADGLDTIAGKVVIISIVGEPALEGAVLKSDPMYGFFGTLDLVFIIKMDLSRISPVSSYTYTTAALARTDFEHQETFVRAAKRYQMDFTRFYNEQVREMVKTGTQAAKLDLTGFPEFRFRPETLDESLTHVWIDIILLLLFSTTFFMLAFISFLRADVR